MKIVRDIDPYIFRGYDIRGIAGENLTEDVAYTIGLSFGTKLANEGKTICMVGRDNRLSSPMLANALITGILETGTDVVDLGVCTTPMYYYACINNKIESGIMVTASHNPKEDNGFKIAFDKSGNACGQDIQDFKDFTCHAKFKQGTGKHLYYDIKEEYFELMKSSIKMGPRHVKVVVDCGNGTTSLFAKDLYSQFPMDLTMMFDESDGSFPNHHPDPSVESNLEQLKKKVVELGADVGISFDGDGDRVGMVTNTGRFVPADQYMILMVRDIFQKSLNKKVLFDVKCSKALPDEIERLGGTYICYKTGNSYTKRETREKDCVLGGELSGHIYFRDKFLGFDSGMYAGLRLVELLSNTDKTMDELLSDIPKYYATPEIKIATEDSKKFQIVEKVKEYACEKGYNINDIDGVRVTFDKIPTGNVADKNIQSAYAAGWALVRASNTGPNITVRFEGSTEEAKEELQTEFMNVLNRYL